MQSAMPKRAAVGERCAARSESNSNRLPSGPWDAKASRSARFDPKRWTSAAGEMPTSRATSARVILTGPRAVTARSTPARMASSETWRGRGLMRRDYK